MSSLLYSLVAEPLAGLINADKDITGVFSPAGREVELFQYADNMSLILNSEVSLKAATHKVQVYCRGSDAKINWGKSLLMYPGNIAPINNTWKFKIVDGPVKILGVYLGENKAECVDLIWSSIIEKLKSVINLWK